MKRAFAIFSMPNVEGNDWALYENLPIKPTSEVLFNAENLAETTLFTSLSTALEEAKGYAEDHNCAVMVVNEHHQVKVVVMPYELYCNTNLNYRQWMSEIEAKNITFIPSSEVAHPPEDLSKNIFCWWRVQDGGRGKGWNLARESVHGTEVVAHNVMLRDADEIAARLTFLYGLPTENVQNKPPLLAHLRHWRNELEAGNTQGVIDAMSKLLAGCARLEQFHTDVFA